MPIIVEQGLKYPNLPNKTRNPVTTSLNKSIPSPIVNPPIS